MNALALSDAYLVTKEPAVPFLDAVCRLLRTTHWASGRSPQTIRTSLENSLCFYLYNNDTLCGLARVITDYATFAYLCDVVIEPEPQGTGCGALMLQTIIDDPELATVPQWRLKTTYAADFYRKFGFSEIQSDITHMEYYPFTRQ